MTDRLAELICGYCECAVCSSLTDDGKSIPGSVPFSSDAYATMRADCERFYGLAGAATFWDDDVAGRIGYEFWHTRNGQGSALWENPNDGERLTKLAESFGTCDLHIGDDGRIHCA